MPLSRVDTSDNPSDIFTKIVSVQRLEWHLALFTGGIRLRNEHGSIVGTMREEHDETCRHAGTKEVGDPKQVLSCPCEVARKLLLLTTLASAASGAEAGFASTTAAAVQSMWWWAGLAAIAAAFAAAVLLMLPGSAANSPVGAGTDDSLQTLDEYAIVDSEEQDHERQLAERDAAYRTLVQQATVEVAQRDAYIQN